MIRSAIERKFEIMGKALNRIGRDEPEMLQHIRDHRDMTSLRNMLVHGHGVIDDHTVWGVMEEDLDAPPVDIGKLMLWISESTITLQRTRGGRSPLRAGVRRGNEMKVKDEYDTVNTMLNLLGGDPIEMPTSGTAREKLQHLLDSYLALLLTRVPRYGDLPDPRMIPDMILVHLFESIDKLR